MKQEKPFYIEPSIYCIEFEFIGIIAPSTLNISDVEMENPDFGNSRTQWGRISGL